MAVAEIALEALGERWALSFGFGAIVGLEREHGGKPFAELVPVALEESEDDPLFLFGSLLRAGLAAQRPSLTMAEVRRLVEKVGRPRLAVLVRRAIAEAVGEAKPGQKDDEREPESIDADVLLASWVQAGQSAESFAAATPRMFNAVMQGHSAQQRWQAWHGWQVARLGRLKRMPSLKDHLAPFDEDHKADTSRGGLALIGAFKDLKAKGVPMTIRRLKV
ncbi:MAG: hypothetical protein ACXWUQ_11020 [Allosphingosinicella sp.]